jgi:hypothetical protein
MRRMKDLRWVAMAVALSGLLAGACTRTARPAECPAPGGAAAPAAPATPGVSRLQPASDELATLARLEGAWTGEGHGEPGTSTVERTYRWVLGGRYLESRNRSEYAPQPKSPKGEVHEDVGYVSHDKKRKTLVLRQFHVESFVNQYVLESATADTFVFVSEAIENIPAGFRARETIRFIDDARIEETFEIAPPDQGFAVYSRTTLQRVPATP